MPVQPAVGGLRWVDSLGWGFFLGFVSGSPVACCGFVGVGLCSVQGSGRAAMGARAVWTEAASQLRPWIPGSWWKASSAVHFKVEHMCEASVFGYVVEHKFPG